MERVAYVSTRFCSNFILPFQKCVSNHSGPPLFLCRNGIVKHKQCFPHASPPPPHINIITGDLHVRPAAVAGSSQEIRSAQQGHGRWEIPWVAGIWAELEVLAPRCGLLFSLPWKIPSQRSSALTQPSCPSRNWLGLRLKPIPEWWSQLQGDWLVPKPPRSRANKDLGTYDVTVLLRLLSSRVAVWWGYCHGVLRCVSSQLHC